jgi:hypothetical protein
VFRPRKNKDVIEFQDDVPKRWKQDITGSPPKTVEFYQHRQ